MAKTEINLMVAELLQIKAKEVIIFRASNCNYVTDMSGAVINYIDNLAQREFVEDALLDAGWYMEKQGDDFIWREKSTDGDLINRLPKSRVDAHRGTAACLAFIDMMESKE